MERRLRFTLSCSEIAWKKSTKSCWASITAQDGKKHRIVLPLGFDDDFTLRGLLHELLHVTIPGELMAFGVFEEDLLERVLEPRMMDHLLRHPRKQQWWLRQLAKAREANR